MDIHNKQHGSLWDRGSADSYYGRPRDPHYYPKGTYVGERIGDLTPAEVQIYMDGYDWNEKHGDKKNWY